MDRRISSWSDQYLFGNEIIDSQHRGLIELCDEIEHEINNGGKDFSVLLIYFTDHSKTHFQTEEKLLREVNFPELEDHEDEHKSFINRIQHFQSMNLLGKLNPIELRDFIRKWVVNHILNSDMKYKPYLEQSKS